MSTLAENFVEHIQVICCTYWENEGDVGTQGGTFPLEKGKVPP